MIGVFLVWRKQNTQKVESDSERQGIQPFFALPKGVGVGAYRLVKEAVIISF